MCSSSDKEFCTGKTGIISQPKGKEQIMNTNYNDLMIFGEGIAREEDLNSLQDVLSFTPFARYWNYCDGDQVDRLRVTAITPQGNFDLKEAVHQGYANNHTPDWDEPAPTIGEQIADKGVTALIFTRRILDQNEDSEYSEYLTIQEPDWTKVRRRIEDALRKNADNATLFYVAQKLSVKIY
jgi:hypothetical protein